MTRSGHTASGGITRTLAERYILTIIHSYNHLSLEARCDPSFAPTPSGRRHSLLHVGVLGRQSLQTHLSTLTRWCLPRESVRVRGAHPRLGGGDQTWLGCGPSLSRVQGPPGDLVGVSLNHNISSHQKKELTSVPIRPLESYRTGSQKNLYFHSVEPKQRLSW